MKLTQRLQYSSHNFIKQTTPTSIIATASETVALEVVSSKAATSTAIIVTRTSSVTIIVIASTATATATITQIATIIVKQTITPIPISAPLTPPPPHTPTTRTPTTRTVTQAASRAKAATPK